jgi:hypothetical protein
MTPESDSRASARALAAAGHPDAFLSYAREDLEVVDVLCAGLVARGQTVWVNRESVDLSASWSEQLRDCSTLAVAIQSSDR